MKLYDIEVCVHNPHNRRAKLWMRAGYAAEVDDSETILCALAMVPVEGWDGEFRLVPKEKKSSDS